MVDNPDSATNINMTETIDSVDLSTKIISQHTAADGKKSKKHKLTDEQLQAKIVQPDWSKIEGSFSNLSVIGLGGMGTVFAAKDALFYRNVALKIMRTDLRTNNKNVDSFIREARITAQIDHPNIVPVYNLGIFKEVGPYFSMKKVEGITLAKVLKELESNDEEMEKKYTLRRRLEIFLSICNGAAFAHSKGVIHCDLKPGNIMLGNYGEVFIMDWGMAVYRSDKDLSSHNTKIDLREISDSEFEHTANITNTINGTPAFMAPEQIFGKTDSIDEQTDVYALGVILYTLLTCTQSPFPPKLAAKKIFEKALSGDFLPPRKRSPKRQISRELEVVCLKAMSPYKHERYANVIALMQDVRNILDMHPVEVYNSPLLNFVKYCRRHPMIPTVLFCSLIILSVFYSYISINRMLTANTLSNVLTITLDESSLMFARVRMNMKRNMEVSHSVNYDMQSEENSDFETKNYTAKLDLNCSHAINTLIQLNQVATGKKYLPVISQTLYFCIHYSLLTRNSDNILKIQTIDDGLVYTAYKAIISKDPVLRRKLQLVALNSGVVKFRTNNKNLNVYITKQIDQDISFSAADNSGDVPEKKSEMIVYYGAFEANLKAGEYSLLVSADGKRNITIPITIEAGENVELDFEFPEVIPQDCVYIHPGHYLSNISHQYSYGKRIYIDGYFLLEREVTIGEYFEFWRQISDRNLKNSYNPNLIYYQNGKYIIRKLFRDNNTISAPYRKEMPIVGISVAGAEAFCKYMSGKLGMKCRLPYFHELEKAARGTGRRIYVWGNRFYHNYALLASNSDINKYPFGAQPKSFPHDYSLYGVYDLAGNVRELVQLKNNADKFAVYGGSYRNTANFAKCGTLSRLAENRIDVGMRYVVELPPKDKNDENKK